VSRLRGLLVRLSNDRSGSLLAEVAIALSVVTVLTLSGVEVARYAMLHQKMERVAASIADLVAQSETLNESDLANIFAAAGHVARPFDIGANGSVIVSSIGASNANPPVVYWQRSGAGPLTAVSRFGTPGGGATGLPNGFAFANGETVIAAEVFFRYTPWVLPNLVDASQLYHSAFFRPRFGALTQVD
jgi:Flp pilus assembly protein TadG